ncbi:MAG: hypothetical protein COB24_13895 [Hyphomicrobiales bacterium]|nr:MAG: hypothetical protein COB24_13895 [Hyphomicrobiales bacterium]
MTNKKPSQFKISSDVPIPKKTRRLKFPDDINIIKEVHTEQKKHPNISRNAAVTNIIRSRLNDTNAENEEKDTERIIKRMKIIENKRS